VVVGALVGGDEDGAVVGAALNLRALRCVCQMQPAGQSKSACTKEKEGAWR
jgi:hypothetical protein